MLHITSEAKLWGRFETCSGFQTRLPNRLQKPAQDKILPHVSEVR